MSSLQCSTSRFQTAFLLFHLCPANPLMNPEKEKRCERVFEKHKSKIISSRKPPALKNHRIQQPIGKVYKEYSEHSQVVDKTCAEPEHLKVKLKRNKELDRARKKERDLIRKRERRKKELKVSRAFFCEREDLNHSLSFS